MSHVTGVVLCTGCSEEDLIIDELNNWLRERGSFSLKPVDGLHDTIKHPQMHILIGGFNGFVYEEEFIELVNSIPWRSPENVILVLQPEQGYTEIVRPNPR